MREGMAALQEDMGMKFDPLKILVTSADGDTQFHKHYLDILEKTYANVGKDKEKCLFQAPLIYNWKLDEAGVVTRVTGIMRTFFMQGALIPFNINPMSVYSMSGSLLIAGNYVHPGYQMEDVIALIRAAGVVGSHIRLIAVPCPVVSGPTSGRTPEEELREWARQARRWAIGAGEVYHYFAVKTKAMPISFVIIWGITFLLYYGEYFRISFEYFC